MTMRTKPKIGPWNLMLIMTGLASMMVTMTMGERSSYGEFCNKTIKCDARSWLTCNPENNQCDCLKPDAMLYEESMGKCASRAGEMCKFVLEEIDENKVFQLTGCVKNAHCGADGFCACESNFYENNVNGTCVPAQSYGETCDASLKCSEYQGLHCSSSLSENGGVSICLCDESRSEYFAPFVQCVGMAGHPCINSKCTQNASCDPQNVCTCDDGHFENYADRRCLAKFELFQNCTENRECHHFKESQLVCVDGQCDCDPKVSRYGRSKRHSNYRNFVRIGDQNMQKFYSFESYPEDHCLGLAGFDCIERFCIPGAFCSHFEEGGSTGKCQCLPDYSLSTSGGCVMGHGRSCIGPNSCDDGLVCRSGYCSCQFYDQQVYNSTTKMCASIVGGPCNKVNATCWGESECHPLRTNENPDGIGHCRCKAGFVQNRNGQCEIAHGMKCDQSTSSESPSVTCDTIAGLSCIDGKCSCPFFSRYNQKLRKCVGLVGAHCPVEDDQNPCVENAGCAHVHPKLDGVCECNEGYQESMSYGCVEVGGGSSEKF